jgi:hypothetical protein
MENSEPEEKVNLATGRIDCTAERDIGIVTLILGLGAACIILCAVGTQYVVADVIDNTAILARSKYQRFKSWIKKKASP